MSFDTLLNVALLAAAMLLMFRFGCGRHMMGHAHSPAHAGGGSGGPPIAANEDVDPVCGMVVGRASASAATFEGRTYYFCSEACRKAFLASPASHAAKAAASTPASHNHGCC